ncbi:flap endonuclease Xni [Endozoicomonas sp. G2_1]|uniref:flap endonuclease Xni n=1 Tax=Endozoicomonas sp. G2_1 TaxID=2821091 RepID=UPI001ADB841E|nr:flap endonuclease Xni [Endozoicomonas sp. G2_1]MBO9488893.1 flap endonuclease Xni [Endozoicomonas sp. G2_1]
MPAHLVLIDALNLIRRIYAVQERPFLLNHELAENTKKQVVHNTKQACLQALSNIIDIHQPSHALAVFDSQQPCWRYQLYPDYKKGRKKMPEHLAQALNEIQDSFMNLGVDSLESEQDEADDLIATLSVKVALRAQYTTIISTDKCFLSLLSEHIKVYDYFNRRYLDADYVQQKFQVNASQLLDFWTMVGDTTNKIPGVAGIGQITAAELLKEHGSLGAILACDSLKASVKTKFEQANEQIELTRQLLTLKQDIPLGFNLKDIRLAQEPAASEMEVEQSLEH